MQCKYYGSLCVIWCSSCIPLYSPMPQYLPTPITRFPKLRFVFPFLYLKGCGFKLSSERVLFGWTSESAGIQMLLRTVDLFLLLNSLIWLMCYRSESTCWRKLGFPDDYLADEIHWKQCRGQLVDLVNKHRVRLRILRCTYFGSGFDQYKQCGWVSKIAQIVLLK